MWKDGEQLSSDAQQLSNSLAAVYQTPAGKKAQLKTVWLHNTNSTAENVKIYRNGNTAAHRSLNISLAANESYEVTRGFPICLRAGGSLWAETTTAGKVNIEIDGREEA